MTKDIGPQGNRTSFWRWATTTPQSYVVYLIALVLVWGLSFYAGMLRPKTPAALGTSAGVSAATTLGRFGL